MRWQKELPRSEEEKAIGLPGEGRDDGFDLWSRDVPERRTASLGQPLQGGGISID